MTDRTWRRHSFELVLCVTFGVFLCFLPALSGAVDSDLGNNNDTFTATKEWQPIKEGQKVPSGLHYRINLKTGVKEAKLLDEDEYLEKGGRDKSLSSSSSSLSIVEGNGNNKTSNGAGVPSSGGGGSEEKDISENMYEYSKEEMEEIKSKFRSYDEIKDQLRDAKLNIRSDSEMIKKLLGEYEEHLNDDVSTKQVEAERILDDLEYLIHDNAIDFLYQGGLEKVILPNLNRTNNSNLKIKGLTLCGTAIQNNQKAQIIAFEKGLAEHLIRFLSTTKAETEINAGMFAFGSLMRRFPLAQKHVLSKSVINVLFDIWTKEINIKIKVKVLAFFTDLLMEADEAQSNESPESEKFRQYREVNLEALLKEFEYCRNVERFVVAEKPTLIANPDQTERIIASLNFSAELCKETWSEDPNLRHVILVLKNRYSDQVSEGTADNVEHLRDVIGEIERLYSVLFQYLKEKVVVKEEL